MDAPHVPLSEVQRIRSTLVTWLGLTLAVLVPLVVMVTPFAVSIATAAVLAVLCYPLYERLRRKLPGWVAAGIVTAGVVVGVVVPILLLLIGAFRQGAEALGAFYRDDAPTVAEAIEAVRRWLPFTDTLGTPEEIRAIIQQGVTAISSEASEVLLTTVQGIPALVLQLVIVVLSTYFFLVDGRRFLAWIAGKLPLSLHIRTMLVASFRGATSAVVLASVAAAAVQAACLLVGYLALGVPAALFAGGAAFVLAWVPTVGTVPVWASAAVYLYLQGSPTRAVIMVVIGLVVGLVDNVVRPLVLRGRQEMHPMVSLLAVIGGLAILGVPGLFLGPLVASMAIAVMEIWPAVATYCGIPVSDGGDAVPEVPMIDRT
jgi:predicted PurR-regulated permease PerM